MGTLICSAAISPTSQLDLLNAHVHHHGPSSVVGLDQGGEVTAEHLLDPAQVRLAVTGNQFGALFVYIQSAVFNMSSMEAKKKREIRVIPEEFSPFGSWG